MADWPNNRGPNMAATDEAIPLLDWGPDFSGLDDVDVAVEALRESGVSGYALSVAHSEMAKARLEADNPGWRKACYVYFGFFGLDGSASFVKIGISNNPRFRMASILTGNPLDCLWVYAARFSTRKEACKIEREIHRRLGESRQRGEWFRVGSMDERDCRQFTLRIKGEIIGSDAGLFEVRE